MKFTFSVGQDEVHVVDFHWSQLTGALRITVDDNVVAEKLVTLSSPTNLRGPLQIPDAEKWNVGGLEVGLVERWCFLVGERERHEICIEKQREKLFAAFRPQTYRIYVDGQLTRSERGY